MLRRFLGALNIDTNDMVTAVYPQSITGTGGDHAVTYALEFLDESAQVTSEPWDLDNAQQLEQFMMQLHNFIERKTGARVDDAHLRRAILGAPAVLRHGQIVPRQDRPRTPPGRTPSPDDDEVAALVEAIERKLAETLHNETFLETSDEISGLFASIVTVSYDIELHKYLVKELLGHYPLEFAAGRETVAQFAARPRLNSITVVLSSPQRVLTSAIFVYAQDPRLNAETVEPPSADTEGDDTLV